MTSPVDFISGPRIGSASGNFANGNTASFTEKNFGTRSSIRPRSFSFAPAITRAAIFAIGTPVALDTNGTVRDARGFTSRMYDSVLNRELNVHQSDHVQTSCEFARLLAQLLLRF